MSRNLHEGPARSAIQMIGALDRSRFEYVPVFSLQPDDLAALEKQTGLKAHNVHMPRPTLKADPAQFLKFAAETSRAAKEITDVIKQEQAALVHANSIVNLHAVIAAKRCGVPLVLHVREMMPDRAPNRIYMRWACSRAAKVIAVSNAVKNKLIAAGADADKIIVHYNGIEPVSVTDEKRHALRVEFGAADDTPLVGIVGTVTELKGQHVLLSAVKLLKDKFPKMRAVVVGGPQTDSVEYMEGLRAFTEREELSCNIVFAGRRDDARECMAAFDVYVQASVRDDSLPRTVIEAMAVGTPVAGSRIGGIPEMVADGKTGFVVTPGDAEALAAALEKLFLSPDLRARMGQTAMQRVADDFDNIRQTEKLLGIYEQVLEK